MDRDKPRNMVITLLILTAMILLGAFVFTESYLRLAEAVRDLGTSATYWFCRVFGMDTDVTPTVNDYSEVLSWGTVLPEDMSELTRKAAEYFSLLFSGENAYFSWYKNSLLVTVIQVVLALTLSSCVGYAFAMYDFKFKNLIFTCVLLVMMVPTEVIILPLYQLIIGMGLVDNIFGIIIPYLVIPMLIFFFRQYLSGIPRDFLDAGRVDGCSEYGIFARIMVPLMKPSFAAMGIYQGMQSWNNFLWPMIVMRTNSKLTLPVGLQSLMSPYGNNYDILIAGACFAIIPILILFACFQSYFVDGMTAGGVKG